MGSSETVRSGVPTETPDAVQSERSRDGPMHVVGVGASAGGLEAISSLLASLPENTGMAIVVIQHLDPQHESKLSDLLSRVTPLPVVEVTPDLAVRPDHVYVIPKNTTMTIARGVLQLEPRGEARVLHLPIDLFLRSLAIDRQDAAIGVILSGTGSDGTFGMEEIKAAGGITFAQDESSAKYPSMPQSAAKSGCVDLVLAPDQIARELARIGQQSHAISERVNGASNGSSDDEERHFRKILELLRSTFRVDFTAYRQTTVRRRIIRRMMLHSKDDLGQYVQHLRRERTEAEALFEDILINVTGFFREPETFEALQEIVFPEILKGKEADTPIRIWVPGCSTGQEAYSLTIALLEFLERQAVRPSIQVFATDLSESVSLARAREGVYPENIQAEVSPERLRRFFTHEQATYRINKSIRDLCVFAKQDVVADPPFSRLDLISCRNVLIYFAPVLQQQVIPTFHYALNPNGFLVLGASETIGSFASLFSAVDPKRRIYAKKATGQRQYPHFHKREILAGEPAETLTPSSVSSVGWQREADSYVLREYAPVGVLVNDDLDILQFRGQTGDYLTPPPGEPCRDVLKMAREGLLLPLRDALRECREEDRPVRRIGVQVRGAGAMFETDLRVIPIKAHGSAERCFLVLFEAPGREPLGASATSVGTNGARRPANWPLRWLRSLVSDLATSGEIGRPPASDDHEVDCLRQELDGMRDYIQSVTQQQDAVNEELKSANEEILSSNEELRSTNEELETAKEELQSVNEELVTVNEQLLHRNQELARLGDDMTNLLASANVPMVAVSVDLRIRWFTPAAGKALSLVGADVGRSIGGLRSVLEVSDLEALITGVIDSVQTEVREVRAKDGRWYSLHVRPYRTADNKIDGAVVVLSDIDAAKRAEEILKESSDFARTIVDTAREPLLILSADLRVISANRSFYSTFRVKREETEGRLVYELGNGRWGIPALRRLLEDVLPSNHAIEDFEIEHVFPGIGHRVMLLNARGMRPGEGAPQSILLAFQDLTEHRLTEAGLRASLQRFRFLTESMPLVIFSAQPDGNLDHFNRHWSEFTGLSTASVEDLNWGQFVHPDDMDETARRWRHSIGTGEPFQLEHRLRRADGVYRWHLTRANALLNAGGNVLIWTGSSTDIDDQKGSESALKQADHYKDEFLAMLAHELRNPLAALECGLTLLGITGDDGARGWAMKTSEHQVQLLTRMVDDLLDISRITRGSFQLRREPVRPAESIERAVDTIRHLVQQRGQRLDVTTATDLPLLDADPARLEQVVCNLLANAAKFTPQGGRIELSAQVEGNEFVLTVRDSGIGIARGFLPYVFDPFAQADKSLGRGRGGLGIGLALVKAIVELHGGSVMAHSEGLEKGCEMIVRLPTIGVDGAIVPSLAAPENRLNLGVDRAPERRRVLVVDDNLEYAQGLLQLLESAGHAVEICTDGPEALSRASEFGPDVILLDLGLPGIDGYEVARRLREDESLARAKIVVISGYASEADRRRSRELGADEHLAKPVVFRELLGVIRQSGS